MMIKVAERLPQSEPKTLHRRCPHCHRILQIKTRETRKDITCPTCKNVFTITVPTISPPVISKTPEATPVIAVAAPSITETRKQKRNLTVPFIGTALVGLAVAFAVFLNWQPSSGSVSATASVESKSSNTPTEKPSEPVTPTEEPVKVERMDPKPVSPAPPTPEPPTNPIIVRGPGVLNPPVQGPAVPPTPVPPKDPPVPGPDNPGQPKPPEPPTPPQKLTEDEIRPFGGLTWDDDPLTAFDKLLPLTKDKCVTVKVGYRGKLCSSRQDAIRHLNGLPQRLHKEEFDKPVVEFIDDYSRIWNLPKGLVYWEKRRFLDLTLECEGIGIHNGVYRTYVIFSFEPGLIVNHAEDCLAQAREVFGPKTDSHLPLCLKTVSLTLYDHTTDTLDKLGEREKISHTLFETLRDKYTGHVRFNGIRTKSNRETRASWTDKSRNELQLFASPKEMYFTYYRDTFHFNNLKKDFDKYLKEAHEKAESERRAEEHEGISDSRGKL